MNNRTISALGSLIAASVLFMFPLAASAWVEYGAFYATPAPHSQLYYQPMYAYAAAPVLSQYQSYPASGYGGYPNYDTNPSYYSHGNNQYMPQYTYSASYPQYNYAYPQAYNGAQYGPYQPYGQNVSMYGQPVPYNYGYPTGDVEPWTGGQLCTFPDYEGRAICGSNPSQRIYDHWTGTWY